MNNTFTPKFKESITITSVIAEMKNKYLAKRLLRSWSEDFTDEDTGEVVSIERNELIFEKGTLLDSHALSEINFLLQSGDIKEVVTSDQCRGSYLTENRLGIWLMVVELNSKKKNIYLHANSILSATDIATDFIEQKYVGSFRFKAIKETDFSNLLSLSELEASNDDDVDFIYYNMEVEVYLEEEGQSYNENFILKAKNAEKAKTLIIYFLQKQREENNIKGTFDVTIISAKTIPCNDVIDYAFCKEHLERLEDLKS